MLGDSLGMRIVSCYTCQQSGLNIGPLVSYWHHQPRWSVAFAREHTLETSLTSFCLCPQSLL